MGLTLPIEFAALFGWKASLIIATIEVYLAAIAWCLASDVKP